MTTPHRLIQYRAYGKQFYGRLGGHGAHPSFPWTLRNNVLQRSAATRRSACACAVCVNINASPTRLWRNLVQKCELYPGKKAVALQVMPKNVR